MDVNYSNGSTLCLQCGLCCDGSLFTKARLRSQELENARTLGMNIYSSGDELAFLQPCHLWNDQGCAIYQKPEYPQACYSFQCKLLKRYAAGQIDLEGALATVRTARGLLGDLQRLAPFNRGQRMTLSSIRLLATYLLTLPEQDRVPHAKFLDMFAQYIRMITREFVYTEETKNEDSGEAETIP